MYIEVLRNVAIIVFQIGFFLLKSLPEIRLIATDLPTDYFCR